MAINISNETRTFIATHRNDNVNTLALKAKRTGELDLHFALDQIAGWQKARTKLPLWAAHEGIIYPPHLSMEQCSSELTALYKAKVAQRWMQELNKQGAASMADLTGGFGVDFSYLSADFAQATYVERQAHLCQIVSHNLCALGRSNATVVNGEAEAYLAKMEPQTLLYADPARRDANGARTFAIADCTPDVLTLKDLMLQKAEVVMLKLSPMLDWRKAIDDFKGNVAEVHIVSSGNECKELLLVLRREPTQQPWVYCVNDGSQIAFAMGQDPAAGCATEEEMAASRYLHEPNTSVMKAGCFGLLCQQYGVKKVGRNSNLFVSTEQATAFPGRSFRICAYATMNKQELKALLIGIKQANITVRNFPLTVAQLRKRLKLKEGGNCYLFATTATGNRHILIKTEKIK